MKIGMIGLGRMGGNMVRRLIKGGHECSVFDQSPDKVKELAREGAHGCSSISHLKSQLKSPRIYWLMLPAGEVTEKTIDALEPELEANDIVVDGGNTYYKDDVKRSERLKKKKVRYMDVGTSGGVWGLERGYSLMIGGDSQAAKEMDPLFRSLAPSSGTVPITQNRDPSQKTADQGYLYCGPAGAGHFVKMIHNGIEYGMMQALAEGFQILRNADLEHLPAGERYPLDLTEIAEVWRRGSVVSSWLLDLVAIALNQDSTLSSFQGHVDDSGEGRWTIQTAIEQGTPAAVLAISLFNRFQSQGGSSFSNQLLSAMRNQFGGHKEVQTGSVQARKTGPSAA
jgi:6-phosphogluconate dehydrogenase